MQQRFQAAAASGSTTVTTYDFDTVEFSILEPFGVQSGLSLGLDATGTATHTTYDAAGNVTATESEPFANQFVMRRATGDRWLNVAVLPGKGGAAGASPSASPAP